MNHDYTLIQYFTAGRTTRDVPTAEPAVIYSITRIKAYEQRQMRWKKKKGPLYQENQDQIARQSKLSIDKARNLSDGLLTTQEIATDIVFMRFV
jgi:hypothetical protein